MTPRPFNDIAYNQFLNEGKLMGCRCLKCGERYVPPRPLCVKCSSPDLKWMEINGRGRLVAFTCIAIAPPFMMAQGYDRKHPYISGVVELDDGGRVDARIEGVDPLKPESIRIGAPMKAIFIQRKNAEVPEAYLAFEPA
jgi:uncharacterized OB-fold protein